MAYVYLILVDDKVRYIGMCRTNKGSRCLDRIKVCKSIARRAATGQEVTCSKFYHKLTKAWLKGCEIKTVILVKRISAKRAYEIEAKEMKNRNGLWNKKLGRPKGGQKEWDDLTFRTTRAVIMAAAHADEEYKKRHREACRKAARKNRKLTAQITKAQWADPKFRDKMIKRQTEGQRNALKNPEYLDMKRAVAAAMRARRQQQLLH